MIYPDPGSGFEPVPPPSSFSDVGLGVLWSHGDYLDPVSWSISRGAVASSEAAVGSIRPHRCAACSPLLVAVSCPDPGPGVVPVSPPSIFPDVGLGVLWSHGDYLDSMSWSLSRGAVASSDAAVGSIRPSLWSIRPVSIRPVFSNK